ncbi:hypothetical protein BUALT_Bualt02G0189700 [Buddleja alternifolia]|uniref:Uncharacterized protein n=1 Tax=Buddleja alternifolia TaxID=168488 RepID=A0AAV6YA31_9LAMI|nr:hypothetical protein BUALT_Bualt02G0189700 [Buddleja alternifolia]
MEKRRESVVLFPFMAQGHIRPSLALAQLLDQKGYNVTFVNTPLNIKKLHKSLPPSSSIKLTEIPFNPSDHGLPPEAENTDSLSYNLICRFIIASPSLKLPFKTYFTTLLNYRMENIVEKMELVMGESEKGKEMRRRACEIKEIIRDATRDEENYKGSSVKAMEEFFNAARSN